MLGSWQKDCKSGERHGIHLVAQPCKAGMVCRTMQLRSRLADFIFFVDICARQSHSWLGKARASEQGF